MNTKLCSSSRKQKDEECLGAKVKYSISPGERYRNLIGELGVGMEQQDQSKGNLNVRYSLKISFL